MQLNADNVYAILMECLFNDGEDTSNHVVGEGVMKKVGFHPGRLEANRHNIEAMLSELPHQFQSTGGGGWSYLNACVNKDGIQWGEHSHIDELIMLGGAIGKIQFCAPREIW